MIKNYDFKSPKKFTKKHMNTAENLYDSFARALAPYPIDLLRSSCRVNINGMVEEHHQEFSSSVQDHSLFDMITTNPTNKGYNEAPPTMEVDTRLTSFMIERLLDGAGSEYDLSKDLTDIEGAILQHILKKVTGFLGEAWGQYLDIKASLTGLQTNPHLLQMSTQEGVVIQMELGMVIEKSRARISMMMPAPDVEEFTSKFGHSFAVSHEKQNKDEQKFKRHYIEQHLSGSGAKLRAILHEFTLDTQDVLQPAPGDVIPPSKEVDSAVPLYVEDVACSGTGAGQTKTCKAVEIGRELQSRGEDILSMDREAIKELMEMEAVPICNILDSLLGRGMGMLVSKMEEADMGSLVGGLLHFNMVVENRGTMKGTSADQSYIFTKKDIIRPTSYIMGVSVDTRSPLDEVTLNTSKEVASQCVDVATGELNDFLRRNMRDTITRVSALDSTERIQDIIHNWDAEDSVLLMELHYVIDRMVESDVYIVATQALKQVLGISDMTNMPCQETEGQALGMPAAEVQTTEHKETTVVQEVSLPEFEYAPIMYTKEQVGEEKKRLLDITLDMLVRLSDTVCSAKDILSLKEGQLLVLNKQADSPTDVVMDGELIDRGDMLVTGDRFGAHIIRIVGRRE